MYKKKYVYICDACGKIELPRTVLRGDIIDTTATPDGWVRAVPNGSHMCGDCAKRFRKE